MWEKVFEIIHSKFPAQLTLNIFDMLFPKGAHSVLVKCFLKGQCWAASSGGSEKRGRRSGRASMKRTQTPIIALIQHYVRDQLPFMVHYTTVAY
jgi:hypothetical protein